MGTGGTEQGRGLGFDPQNSHQRLDMVTRACDPSTGEMETKGSGSSVAGWSSQRRRQGDCGKSESNLGYIVRSSANLNEGAGEITQQFRALFALGEAQVEFPTPI